MGGGGGGVCILLKRRASLTPKESKLLIWHHRADYRASRHLLREGEGKREGGKLTSSDKVGKCETPAKPLPGGLPQGTPLLFIPAVYAATPQAS